VDGFEGKAISAQALVTAVANVAQTYAELDNLILALNAFFW
jgi:hypothetical protein